MVGESAAWQHIKFSCSHDGWAADTAPDYICSSVLVWRKGPHGVRVGEADGKRATRCSRRPRPSALVGEHEDGVHHTIRSCYLRSYKSVVCCTKTGHFTQRGRMWVWKKTLQDGEVMMFDSPWHMNSSICFSPFFVWKVFTWRGKVNKFVSCTHTVDFPLFFIHYYYLISTFLHGGRGRTLNAFSRFLSDSWLSVPLAGGENTCII